MRFEKTPDNPDGAADKHSGQPAGSLGDRLTAAGALAAEKLRRSTGIESAAERSSSGPAEPASPEGDRRDLPTGEEGEGSGPGEWREASALDDVRPKYADLVTGASPGRSYVVAAPDGKSVKFDGYDPSTGTLVSMLSPANDSLWIDRDGKATMAYKDYITNQAIGEISAAKGRPIQWACPKEGTVEIVKKILGDDLGEKIEVRTVEWPAGDGLWPRAL